MSGIDPTKLKPIEIRIMQLTAQGLTSREIAAELKMSARTVQNWKQAIYFKLDVTRAIAAVNLCRLAGVIM